MSQLFLYFKLIYLKNKKKNPGEEEVYNKVIFIRVE